MENWFVMEFKLVSDFQPTGDQPRAIADLTKGVIRGDKHQVLLGVTGSGKTYTIANVIANVRRPTLIISHNKTLAAQLYQELQELFPDNAICYYVSYYDYFQPEAYLPASDKYIEKDASRNEEIEMYRLRTMMSLLSRRDVIVVASVSCIYTLGSPSEYKRLSVTISKESQIERDDFLRKLVDIQYERNNYSIAQGEFRVRGNIVEVVPGYADKGIRVEFADDKVASIEEFDIITGKTTKPEESVVIFPAEQRVIPPEEIEKAIKIIEEDLDERIKYFQNKEKQLISEAKDVEAKEQALAIYRLKTRTKHDIERIREFGSTPGIENYARYFDGRKEGERPFCLLDFFPEDYLIVIDESHVTIPQIGGMLEGDRSRKRNLVDYGFRLPSAFDNRPLSFDEYESLLNQVIYMSATPAEYEKDKAGNTIVEQIVRPTGLLDPEVVIKPAKGQVDDLIAEIRDPVARKERILVTTLTKRMAESLTDYLQDLGFKVRYLHSEIDTLERTEILRALRMGDFDILVGINLLREGLDLPEVSLVAILDADKEGFLRTERSLIQTIGRASRNINGRVVLYGDTITLSMENALYETNRRRRVQAKYNAEYGITPATIQKAIRESMTGHSSDDDQDVDIEIPADRLELEELLNDLDAQMKLAAERLDFERAAYFRDTINQIKSKTSRTD